MKSKQSGFTLIELMIALVLGLIIVAAGVMLFLSAQQNVALQNASSEMQNNANYALNYIIKDLRLANLDTGNLKLNKDNSNGGIIFANNDSSSNNEGSRSNYSPSNITGSKSDVLTIRYKPQVESYDCAGKKISEADIATDDLYIVQSYFIREVSPNELSNNEKQRNTLTLVCKAGRQKADKTIEWNGNGSQMIIRRADYFKVNLIVKNKQSLREVGIGDYTNSQGDIVGVNLSIIARSPQRIDTEGQSIFPIFDQQVSLADGISKKYVREVISMTIAFRNTFGEH